VFLLITNLKNTIQVHNTSFITESRRVEKKTNFRVETLCCETNQVVEAVDIICLVVLPNMKMLTTGSLFSNSLHSTRAINTAGNLHANSY